MDPNKESYYFQLITLASLHNMRRLLILGYTNSTIFGDKPPPRRKREQLQDTPNRCYIPISPTAEPSGPWRNRHFGLVYQDDLGPSSAGEQLAIDNGAHHASTKVSFYLPPLHPPFVRHIAPPPEHPRVENAVRHSRDPRTCPTDRNLKTLTSTLR